ncbi:hypothetical protein ICHIJ1_17950 [Fluviibacter phosphoraccumulans]|uniref:hypothetical protein n=1 Tax=Fluviibacter phosphoraccumulans TaxID=1751046 RepID=UPI00136721CE|nr:hypothetical protein [Fluviibacter phosphoraccumulans]BBU71876.1 hypothetical protein ICHIJ1_17950 [Fluviibacter phosphoraccumulans]
MHTQITRQHQAILDSAHCDADQDFDDDYRPELDRRNFGQSNPLTPEEKIAIGNILQALRHG